MAVIVSHHAPRHNKSSDSEGQEAGGMKCLPILGACPSLSFLKCFTGEFHCRAVESNASRDFRHLQGQISGSASCNIDAPTSLEPSSSCPASSVTGFMSLKEDAGAGEKVHREPLGT